MDSGSQSVTYTFQQNTEGQLIALYLVNIILIAIRTYDWLVYYMDPYLVLIQNLPCHSLSFFCHF